jgi:hypothetical protein
MSSKSLIAIGLLCAVRPVLAQRPPPSLGNAASFAMLAPAVTSSGSTVVTGNLGGNSIHGFPPGVVLLGTTLHGITDPLRDAAAAYEDLRTRPCDQALQGDGLAPHVYCSASPFTLQGTLTLDAHGDPNAFWIFQLGSGLTTAAGSAVRVINGGWEGNVFWQVNGQVVLGDGTAFIGNVVASKGITFGAGATLSGRALVLDGTATLSGNSISLCCKAIEVINPANSTVAANAAFSETFTQKGSAAPFTFALGSGTLPNGFSLAATGTLSGTTTQVGTFPITVRVTDATKCTGTSATYVLTVTVNCAPITITNPAIDHGIAGVPFSQTFTQIGAVEPAVFTPVSTLPSWLTLDSDGTLHDVPAQIGTLRISVKVTGANGCFLIDPTDYVLTIDCQKIAVTNPAIKSGTAGVFFSAQFTQTGAIGTATFTLASGTLPPGLTLSSSGLLSGTTNQTGPISITVIVTDSNNCTATSSRYDAFINCQKITVVPPVTTSGTTGTPFCEAFTATGILGTPTFSSSGALPTGLTFASNGMLCGTPAQTGCFPITVTVMDTNGCAGTAQYTLCITNAFSPPRCPPIVGSPTILPPAVNTVPYLQAITPSGGTAPYTLVVIGGALPAGLTLNSATGVISGIPTVSADFDVVIRITDAAGCSGIVFYYPPTIPAISPWGLAALMIVLGFGGALITQRGRVS